MKKIDWSAVDSIIQLALDEDLGEEDITTAGTVDPNTLGEARIVAKRPCVIAGLFMVERVYRLLLPGQFKVQLAATEGQRVSAGTLLCTVIGPCAGLLAGERTVLNFLQRMCGIANETARFVRAVRSTAASIFDTRKTAPGHRALDKYAVRAGGGCNHRMGLHDAVLIKENHIEAAGGVENALKRLQKRYPGVTVEIEVEDFEQLVYAVEYGADIVLLDNMRPDQVKHAVKLVGNRVQLEVSGGITLKTAGAMADTGVQRISVGALTHSVKGADLSMLIESRGDQK